MRVRLAGYHQDDDWVGTAGIVVDEDAEIAIWNPSHEIQGRPMARPAGVAIAYLQVRADPHGVVHPGARACVRRKADAYAGDVTGLIEAHRWLTQPQETPEHGALIYLVYLGALGARPAHLPIGHVFGVPSASAGAIVGRAKGCVINLRHGAHSDGNLCARHHARLEYVDDGLRVTDLGSTNGTFLNGERKSEFVAEPGAEIAFAGIFRFRVTKHD